VIPLPDEQDNRAEYLNFWGDVGAHFPSLKGAASTRYYFECEQSLLLEFFPPMQGLKLLKTDLWDEAKNTEILRWAAEQGARPYGIDIAMETAAQARETLSAHQPAIAVADVRALPFPSDSFDLVYSMGTIEHFAEYQAAAAELYRVLKPGGTAIVGVPNKLDPFLRPAMVHAMNLIGLYSYGREKSFTARALRRLLSAAGFEVGGCSGVLFMPGWLRMLDLFLYVRFPRLKHGAAAAVAPFAAAYRRFPWLRRHSYLIAFAAYKDAAAQPSALSGSGA
jgi:SAM-dependent methyltransferase